MELRDLIVTPLLIIAIYFMAYAVRPWITDAVTSRYFLPALTVRIVGALAVGLIYQFYYGGGDTFNYHTHGSRHVWEAFMDSVEKGVKLLIHSESNLQGTYEYSKKILFFDDPSSYMVVRLAAIFDILTFSSYSGTAVLFAVFSFVGGWIFFLTFYRQYPHLHRGIAVATFFIPSVFFWGSGILKDTITLSCVGVAVYQVHKIFNARRFSLVSLGVLVVTLYLLYSIKLYILLVFLPAAIVWVFLFHFNRIQSSVLRAMLLPVMLIAAGGLAFFSIIKAGEDNPKYSINKLAETAQVTAYDIRYWTGREAGSGYSLGELDGSFSSMVKLAPQAVNVTLFRPYLWEVRNPLMLISAVEGFVFLILTLYLIVKVNKRIFRAIVQPNTLFLLIFSLTFSFAVGVSTFNFGTLVRYKIPVLPFFAIALILMYDYANSRRKLEALEETEY